MATVPISAVSFLSTLGVNTHLEEGTAEYGNLSDVIADLNYLGINQIRDDITDGGGPLPLSSYATLANAGVHFAFLSLCGGTTTPASLASTIATIAAINAANPGSVIAVEGPNEINNFSMTYNGVAGTAGAVAFQERLYTDVHSNPDLAGVSVYYFTGYGQSGEATSTPLAVGPNPYTTAGLADYDNGHPYPQAGQAPYSWISLAGVPNEVPSSLLNESAPYGPFVFTETGYSSDDVSLKVQAQYTIDLLFDAASQGSSKTFLYELMDEGDGMGLFNATTPKPVATAIHNLTTILADSGTGGVAPTALNDTITGLSSNGHSLLIEKSTGIFDLALWNEGSRSSNVSVNLGATYASVDVVDVVTGETVSSQSNVSSVSMALGQDPYIVEITGQATSGGGSTTGTHHHHH